MEGVNWIHLARDRQNWRDIVKTVMNFGFRKMRDNSCLTVDLSVHNKDSVPGN